jgi:hypothetical protein
MTIADKLQTISDNTQRVFDAGYLEGKEAGGYNEGFDAGKKAERDAFWDAFLAGAEDNDFRRAFAGHQWGLRNFFPTRDVKPVGDANQIFYDFGSSENDVNDAAGDLAQRFRDCGVVLDTSKATSLSYAFAYARISCIPAIDVTGLVGSSVELFAHTWYYLTKIEKIITNETVTYNYWFDNCTGLTDVTFSGNIANDINLQWSTKLTWNSFQSLYNCACEGAWATGKTFTLTFARSTINRLFESSPGANDGTTTDDWATYEGMAPFTITLV